jgi:hypothetical protein
MGSLKKIEMGARRSRPAAGSKKAYYWEERRQVRLGHRGKNLAQ